MKRHQTILFCCMLCVALCMLALPSEAQNTSAQTPDPEIVFWETVRESNDIDMYRAYIKQYPGGHFVELAQIKIKALSKKDLDGIKSEAKQTDRPADKPTAPRIVVHLRSRPEKVSPRDLRDLIKKNNFSIPKRNPDGEFKNAFADNQDGTITDEATGLIWQAGHSRSSLNRLRAKQYIEKLNRERYAGRAGWRMPTIEELASLMEIKPQPPLWLHLDPIFQSTASTTPDRFWSSDSGEAVWQLNRHAWIADFWRGKIDEAAWSDNYSTSADPINEINYVKAVCSK